VLVVVTHPDEALLDELYDAMTDVLLAHGRLVSLTIVEASEFARRQAAQAALVTEGQRADTHRGVAVLFGLLLVKTGKVDRRWGKLLAKLKDDREAGDYDPLSYVDEATRAARGQ
jgi:hypothetical protein